MDYEEEREEKAELRAGFLSQLIGIEEESAIDAGKKAELVSRFKEFVGQKHKKDIVAAATEERPFVFEYGLLEKFSTELADLLSTSPKDFFELAEDAVREIDLPLQEGFQMKVRVKGFPGMINVRDLRSKHIGRFITTEGIVRKSSEIRPEIMSVKWECTACNEAVEQKRRGNFILRPFRCDICGKREFRETERNLVDTRWIVIEEPFELTEGERPSQIVILLKEDLVNQEGRRLTDPGNRLRMAGILKDIPKGKGPSVKLDFYLDSNMVEPTEVGWEKLVVSKEDEEKIRKLAADEHVYEMLVDSLAPSLYGLREIKEAIILQMFSGVQRILKDKTKFRGEIHLLLIGDPASGKSQLLKLVPQLVPRGKYVSGKGTTTAGLTATVSKDEQFMGGWVLEAGAMVLANKGMLSVDEFEKMAPEDQVAMHEALEQGTVSIAKASIIATLPAQTSVLAGGNPKFSRFDPYMAISKQIIIPETLLSRFDLKFALRDQPNAEVDRKVVDHILSSREEGSEISKPLLDPEFTKKYVAYAKEKCLPKMTKESGELLKKFYVEMRKKAQQEGAPIPITLRQFEALIRLSEASAKVQLSSTVRKEDAKRAMRLVKYSLQQLGYDPETGTIDVDKAEGATPAKERSNIRVVLDIVESLGKKKKEIAVNDIVAMAKTEGVDDPESVVERLKREGMLFEPSPGFVQKV